MVDLGVQYVGKLYNGNFYSSETKLISGMGSGRPNPSQPERKD